MLIKVTYRYIFLVFFQYKVKIILFFLHKISFENITKKNLNSIITYLNRKSVVRHPVYIIHSNCTQIERLHANEVTITIHLNTCINLDCYEAINNLD